MLVDQSLYELIEMNNFPSVYDIVLTQGVWYTEEEMKYDLEFENLEEMLRDYYWILCKNKFKFCNPETMENHLEELKNDVR